MSSACPPALLQFSRYGAFVVGAVYGSYRLGSLQVFLIFDFSVFVFIHLCGLRLC